MVIYRLRRGRRAGESVCAAGAVKAAGSSVLFISLARHPRQSKTGRACTGTPTAAFSPLARIQLHSSQTPLRFNMASCQPITALSPSLTSGCGAGNAAGEGIASRPCTTRASCALSDTTPSTNSKVFCSTLRTTVDTDRPNCSARSRNSSSSCSGIRACSTRSLVLRPARLPFLVVSPTLSPRGLLPRVQLYCLCNTFVNMCITKAHQCRNAAIWD